MDKSSLTAERLRELVSYDPETGIFTRLVRVARRVRVGDVAGAVNKQGYVSFAIDGKTYSAQRLAWLYVHGKWPDACIDHLNGIRHDNRFANLRDVNVKTNVQNQRSPRINNKSGLLGVRIRKECPANPFVAQIQVDGRVRYIGNFPTGESAHAAYLNAKRLLHAGNTL